MGKLYYTIGEVAGIFGENTSLIRFWAETFHEFIHPQRNAKGNRLFSQEDVEAFSKIHYLVRVRRMTLDGAASRMKEDGKKVASETSVLNSLKSILSRLEEVRRSMD